ncbi:MAG: prepilin-type N-terminal cleavage/methylation domain-containing protein [Phycisphaeraceae bacterium]|nr:prepilin-type N-terminal cleavage/methylation domain-containing protein [Phycisphaeraceae bacterium]MCW5753181.1 prepilin-type N-terminal cleavage/methylation domain-containing protein [Phycisphaeraceae bacterium]
MKAHRNRNRGFTLVEILIVVVILGILAAIVVPQFTNAANEARGGNIATQESTIQNQLELFAARNNGSYPDLAGDEDWAYLVTQGYFKAPPANPFVTGGGAGATTVAEFGDADTTIAEVEAEAAGADPADGAWIYNRQNGILRAARGGL